MSKNKKQQKTNVMRILSQAKIPYEAHYYDTSDGDLSGTAVAKKLGEDVASVYKTLVCRAHSGAFYVFVITVAHALNTKKPASAVGEKSVEMIPQKELLPNTGYIHGGCSPVGMKKPYPTTIHQDAENLPVFYVSAGKVGAQVGVNPKTLAELIGDGFADLVA